MKIEKGTILIAKYTDGDLIEGEEYTISDLDGITVKFICKGVKKRPFPYRHILTYFDIKQETPKVESYVVIVTGLTNYEYALEESKRLCKEHKGDAYIYKAITKVELNDIKITEL